MEFQTFKLNSNPQNISEDYSSTGTKAFSRRIILHAQISNTIFFSTRDFILVQGNGSNPFYIRKQSQSL